MEYVWVAGASRSGKRTLILKLCAGDSVLLQECRINPPVEALKPSVAPKPQPFTVSHIVEAAQQSPAESLLIKWQLRNARQGHVRELITLEPTSVHRILVVERPKEETLRRKKGGRNYLPDQREEYRRSALDSELARCLRHLVHAVLPPQLTVEWIRNQGGRFQRASSSLYP